MKSKKRPEFLENKLISVRLRPSVAKDLITVLAKFSEHKAELLQHGQKDHADRLLALNWFREDVAAALRKHEREE